MRYKYFTTFVVLLLKKQRQKYSSKTKWNASQPFEDGGKEEPSFQKELPLSPFLAVSTFTALLSKSFSSSWVSFSQMMFPLRKQHIPCLFLSCQLLFLITGWGQAGFGLSSGQYNGLSLLATAAFSRPRVLILLHLVLRPKMNSPVNPPANLANLLTLLWDCTWTAPTVQTWVSLFKFQTSTGLNSTLHGLPK